MTAKSGTMLLRQSRDVVKEYWVLKEKLIITMAELMMITKELSKEQKKLCLIISDRNCDYQIQALNYQRYVLLKEIQK